MKNLILVLNTTIAVAGDGRWSSRAANVRLTEASLAWDDEVSEDDLPDTIVSCTVEFDTNDWNTAKDGLIYTDSCIDQVAAAIAAAIPGADNIELEWSEQGMQGEDYLHFDMRWEDALALIETGE